MTSAPRVYVVFPVHNRLEATRAFLDCMAAQTWRNLEVVICDDGSSDGTGEYLRSEHPDVRIVPGTGNLWWTAGINRCVRDVLDRADDADFILTINNDVVVAPGYIEQKVRRGAEHPGAIIGSLCVFKEQPERIETSGFIMNFGNCESQSITRRGELRRPEHHGIREVTHLPGKGVLVPVSVYQRIGLYDETGLPHYHADTDFTLRAHEAGIRVLVDFDSIVMSDVNLKNMTSPLQEMTLAGIIRTFQGSYTPNNFKINLNFARKHFPTRYRQFLLKKYVRIIGGMVWRYIAFQSRRLNQRGRS